MEKKNLINLILSKSSFTREGQDNLMIPLLNFFTSNRQNITKNLSENLTNKKENIWLKSYCLMPNIVLSSCAIK